MEPEARGETDTVWPELTEKTPADRWRDRIAKTAAATLALAAVIWAVDLPSRLGFALYTEQFLAFVLALSLGIVFVRPGRFARSKALRWLAFIDCVLGLCGTVLGLWVAIDYPRFVGTMIQLPLDGLIIAAVLFGLVLEALRRSCGLTLTLVVLALCGYGLVGHMIEGPLQTRAVSADRLVIYLGFDPNGLLGLTLMVAATVVVAFVLFGQVLMQSGGAEFFNDISLATMGRKRGGAAKISIVASALFGSISGVVVSNIVATGVVTIRLMIQSGFSRKTAGAVEAVASTGGQILPPVMGAVAFLMADILQLPYSDIALAALVPALLYYVALFIQVDLRAARDGIAAIDPALIPKAGGVMRRGWVFILPFAAIVVALFFFAKRPETAAMYGAIVSLAIGLLWGYGDKRIRVRDLGKMLVETGMSTVDIILIAAAAGFIIGTLNLTGLGFGLTFALVSLGSSNLFLLLLIAAVVCVILGMGMPTVGVYLLLAVLVAPALVETGVDPIAAHLFIFYLGMMSMVTPPVAIGAFFAAMIAKAKPMETAIESMRLGWTAYIIPLLFVVSPALLLKGGWSEIALEVSLAVVGVYAVSVGFAGYFRDRLGAAHRLAFIVSGALLLMPVDVGSVAKLWLNGAGAVLLLALILQAYRQPQTAAPEIYKNGETS